MPSTLKDPEAAALRLAILRYLLGRCRDNALAEDLAHDVLERVLRAMALTEVRNPAALAYRVADNLLIDNHRRVVRRPFALIRPDLPIQDASTSQTAEARIELARVMSQLRAMPEQRRRIFVRRRFDGASCAEIAQEFGLSIKTVEKHITKALADLANALESNGGRE